MHMGGSKRFKLTFPVKLIKALCLIYECLMFYR